MKRKLTDEQLQATAARRERFKGFAATVAKMTDDERWAMALKMPVTTIEGKALSHANTCLIALQLPTATIVGGFRQWRTAGRFVRRGEKGLCLWVPTGKGGSEDTPQPGGDEGKKIRFIVGTVFDVVQTDADDGEEESEVAA